MKLRTLWGATILLGSIVVVGCSGASSSELFAQPATSELPSEPEDELPSASTPESSRPTGGGSRSNGDGSSDDGSSDDASSAGASGGAPGKAQPSPAGTILCGPAGAGGAKKTCKANAEICCVGWGSDEFECEPAGKLACVTRSSLACDDGSDCPSGQVCCGRRERRTGYTKVECRTECKDGPGIRAMQFCDPNAENDECAPSGKQCVPSDVMPGYHVCD